jgi:F-type H+-transporting ATPase subunit a
MTGEISIHLAPYVIGTLFGVPITNTLLTSFVVMLLLGLFAFIAGRSLRYVPGKGQAMLEMFIMYPYSFAEETLEDKKLTQKVFPFLMTIFLFVLAANWFGLLPFVGAVGINDDAHHITPLFYPVHSDLNNTLALALLAVAAIQILGVSLLGFFKYGSKFISFKSPLAFIIGLIELISEIARVITFSFRLFGNIFAGKVLILVLMAFVPLVLPVPLLAFEVFVGFIQAAIFALLTLFFIKIAVEEPH